MKETVLSHREGGGLILRAENVKRGPHLGGGNGNHSAAYCFPALSLHASALP